MQRRARTNTQHVQKHLCHTWYHRPRQVEIPHDPQPYSALPRKTTLQPILRVCVCVCAHVDAATLLEVSEIWSQKEMKPKCVVIHFSFAVDYLDYQVILV